MGPESGGSPSRMRRMVMIVKRKFGTEDWCQNQGCDGTWLLCMSTDTPVMAERSRKASHPGSQTHALYSLRMELPNRFKSGFGCGR